MSGPLELENEASEESTGFELEKSLSSLVLVVDDERSTVLLIERLLKRAGFRTASAVNVAEALKAIASLRPDLVIMDVHLPDGSGFDVCRSLQAESTGFSTPILFISANDDISTKVRGFEVGGVDYITKPILGREVIARVRTHLRLKQAYEQLAELQTERVRLLACAQHSLMPRSEDLPEARFHVSICQVLKAGGDFYDVFPAGEGIFDYLVADASGHDLAASFWTASLKTLASEFSGPLQAPLQIVGAINTSLCRLLPPGAFFTLIYARLNHRTGQLTLINAAHPPAILSPAGRCAPVVLRQEGDVVGAFPDAVFGFTELTLQPGDRIFFYTDGLIETGGSAEEGIERLAEACSARSSMPLKDMVPFVVNEIAYGSSSGDDTLLLGVER